MNPISIAVVLIAAWSAPKDADVDARIRAPKKDVGSRVVDVTDAFVGAPYVLSPLGEGPGNKPDDDPRIRFDEFDCTTFVETAIALTWANDLDEAKRLIDVVRYEDGDATYLKRRHFPEAEWIPQLEKLGFLKDITRDVGGDDVKIESKTLNLAVWKKSSNEHTPKLPDDRIPNGTFSLTVWPLKNVEKHVDKIPAGTIMHIVRVDFSNEPVRVSHQGIVIEKNGKKYMRHAADRLYHHVVDEPIEHFFHRMDQYTLWPVAGVHLTLMTEPDNWRALLRPDSKLPTTAAK